MANWIRTRATYSTVIAAPAADAWELISDFAGILRYWPQDDSTPIPILSVALDGRHKDVPRARHVLVPGGSVTEVCYKEDEITRRIYYDMNDEGIPGVRNYMATICIDELEPEKCRMAFSSNYDTPPDSDQEFYVKRIEAVYKSISEGFAAYFAMPEDERPKPTYLLD